MLVAVKVLRQDIKTKLEELLSGKTYLRPPKNPEKKEEIYVPIQIFLGYLPLSNNLLSVTPGLGIRSKNVDIKSDEKQIKIVIEAILYQEDSELRFDSMEELLELIADSFQPGLIYGNEYFTVADMPIKWDISDMDLDPYIIGTVEIIFNMPQSENIDHEI